MDQIIFHRGEHAAQAKAGVASPYAAIRNWMPDQHRAFFELLPFLPIATPDADGGPLATILTGAPGFVTSPDPRTLHIAAHPAPDDPAAQRLRVNAPVGILGIDLGTRRRNRANGTLRSVGADGLTVDVSQSFGNCPQYIQTRIWQPIAGRPGATEALPGLDPAAQRLVETADTFFVASSSGNGTLLAGGMDISHRGGRPGFVAVANDTLTIPDFHGNHYFNTLGNFMLDPRAAVLFVDWDDGTLLHLQGRVEILWGAEMAFPGAERFWRLHVTRAWRRPHAMPIRWTFQDYAPQTLRTGSW
jgi:uncharacterized protein